MEFFKRLFCFHLNWAKGRPLRKNAQLDDYSVINGKGQLIPWTCTRCSKTKHFTKLNPPVQYLGRQLLKGKMMQDKIKPLNREGQDNQVDEMAKCKKCGGIPKVNYVSFTGEYYKCKDCGFPSAQFPIYKTLKNQVEQWNNLNK